MLQKINSKKVRVFIKDLAVAIAIIVVLFFCFWPASIDGSSMNPTLDNGDRIIISRFLLWFRKPIVGDLVICKMHNNDKDIEIIKRVVGLPKDNVLIDNGKVYINGKRLYEDYLLDEFTTGYVNMKLEEDEYFILGDNRQSSSDSRELGAIKQENIVGFVILRWYPFNNMRMF